MSSGKRTRAPALRAPCVPHPPSNPRATVKGYFSPCHVYRKSTRRDEGSGIFVCTKPSEKSIRSELQETRPLGTGTAVMSAADKNWVISAEDVGAYRSLSHNVGPRLRPDNPPRSTPFLFMRNLAVQGSGRSGLSSRRPSVTDTLRYGCDSNSGLGSGSAAVGGAAGNSLQVVGRWCVMCGALHHAPTTTTGGLTCKLFLLHPRCPFAIRAGPSGPTPALVHSEQCRARTEQALPAPDPSICSPVSPMNRPHTK